METGEVVGRFYTLRGAQDAIPNLTWGKLKRGKWIGFADEGRRFILVKEFDPVTKRAFELLQTMVHKSSGGAQLNVMSPHFPKLNTKRTWRK
jgi:hypothetical protein